MPPKTPGRRLIGVSLSKIDPGKFKIPEYLIAFTLLPESPNTI
jgi:hypothetical protein